MRASFPKLLLAVALVGYGAYNWSGNRPVSYGPGAIAPDIPLQSAAGSASSFRYNGYDITPLANFDIKARVLGKEEYRLGREAELAPVDLALGWGPMSDEAVLEKISIRQSNRFYHWSVSEFPIPQREIESNSANMHLIPADLEIERRLKAVRTGQLVRLQGYLVKVEAGDNWTWMSSLTREDTGRGACELVWVGDLEIL